MTTLELHGYWRSTASYRVRIGLNLKGLPWRSIPHDLRLGEQRGADYLALAPHGLTPVLQDGPFVLTQSLAILEYLDEAWPAPALLPKSAQDRAIVRSMALLIACDIHPLNNLRVLSALRQKFGADEPTVTTWISDWINRGFEALEVLIERHGGAFSFGDTPTLADCCLVPQVYSAQRFGLDLTPYPRIAAAAEGALALDAFQSARPELQPDADRS